MGGQTVLVVIVRLQRQQSVATMGKPVAATATATAVSPIDLYLITTRESKGKEGESYVGAVAIASVTRGWVPIDGWGLDVSRRHCNDLNTASPIARNTPQASGPHPSTVPRSNTPPKNTQPTHSPKQA